MPNTREKLIELLAETPGIGWSPSARHMVADHLIANGVTIADDVSAVAYNLSPTDKDINVPSKWIPVTERLPENGQTVLAYYQDTSIDTTRYSNGFSMVLSNGAFVRVTHWMPLPELPKGE